jgi:hypothetical protein
MRLSAAGMVSLMAVVSPAQSPEETMRGLADQMGLLGKGTVTTLATEVRHSRETTTRVSAAFSCPQGGKPQLEVLTTRDGRLVQRMTCDGDSIWIHSILQNSYSSVPLSKGAALSHDWRNRLFQTVLARSTGATVFTVSLLADAFGRRFAEGARWEPWHRGAQVSLQGLDVTYRVASPSHAVFAYHLERDEDERLHWTGATFESLAEPGAEGFFRWSATVYPGQVPADFDPKFVPPKGARPMSIEQPANR